MAKIVRNAGYGYDNITEPLEAIPILLELRPKLIFLDLVMPYTNGYELCAQIRRTSTFRKTPIIIVTNNDGIIDRVRARFVGASGFFSKPVREKRVLKVLKKHLVLLQTESSLFSDKLSV
ncbi:MAG: response regulator [Cyanobacteria bacterium J06636_28]